MIFLQNRNFCKILAVILVLINDNLLSQICIRIFPDINIEQPIPGRQDPLKIVHSELLGLKNDFCEIHTGEIMKQFFSSVITVENKPYRMQDFPIKLSQSPVAGKTYFMCPVWYAKRVTIKNDVPLLIHHVGGNSFIFHGVISKRIIDILSYPQGQSTNSAEEIMKGILPQYDLENATLIDKDHREAIQIGDGILFYSMTGDSEWPIHRKAIGISLGKDMILLLFLLSVQKQTQQLTLSFFCVSKMTDIIKTFDCQHFCRLLPVKN